MGTIYKQPVTFEQVQEQVKAQETKAALDDLKQQIKDEKTTRSNDDTVLRQNISFVHDTLIEEISARTAAETQIKADLLTETNQRTAADAELQNAITTEKSDRENADTTLRFDFNAAMETEKLERANAVADAVAAIQVAMGDAKSLEDIENEKLREQMEIAAQNQNAVMTALNNKIDTEAQTRANEDTKLLNAITAEKSARETALTNAQKSLNTAINKEISDRENAVTAVQTNLTNAQKSLNTAINKEVSDRKAAISGVQNDLSDAQKSLNTAINKEISDRENAISGVQTNLTNAQKSLNTAINKEISDRENAISGVQNDLSDAQKSLNTAINKEVSDRENAISGVQTNLTNAQKSLNTAINKEISDRKAAISGVQNDLSDAQKSLNTAINKEVSDRENAISGVQTNLTNAQKSLNTAINKEISDRENAISAAQTSLTDKINTEVQNLKTADTALENSLKGYVDGQISNVESGLNVFTSPTTTKDGKQGQVPAPSKGTNLQVLTNFGWRDLDDAELTVSTVPVQSGTLTYNGESQTPTWLNFDNTKLQIDGEISGTDAKTYTVTFTPAEIYLWADTLNQEPKTVTWTIQPLKLAKPAASVTEFTFNNAAQGITVSNFDSTYINQTGNISATNANSYSAVFKLRNTTNTKWSDNSTADVTISWKINPLKLPKPAAAVTEFAYSGSAKTLEVTNFNATYESQTGVTSATNVGEYSVVYKLRNTTNTTWSDDSTADVTINWKIEILKLAKPEVAVTEFTYSGAAKTLSVTGFNSTYENQGGSNSEIDAGNYSIVFSLKSKTNTTWADSSTDDVIISWKIKPMKLSKPTAAVTEFTFNNAAQGIEVLDYDSTYESQTGVTAATNVGNYSVVYKLRNTNNTTWSDDSISDVTINWKIEILKLAKPEVAVTEFTYSGAAKTLSVTDFNSTYENQGGSNSEVDAGNYNIVFSLKSKTNTTWADSSTDDINISWKIKPMKLSKPTASVTEFIYDGSAKTLEVTDHNATYENQADTISATNVGSYSAVYSLKDTNNTTWQDDSTADVTISWKIEILKLAKPAAAVTSFPNDGTTHTLEVTNFNSTYETETGTRSASATGNYSVSYKLKDTNNTKWQDDSVADVVISWNIENRVLTEEQSTGFEQIGTLYYTGSPQTVSIKNFDENCHVLSGDSSATAVGNYTGYISPKPGFVWANGTNSAKSFSWSIKPMVIAKPTCNTTYFDYDGKTHRPEVQNYNSAYMTQTGDTVAHPAGNYTLIYSLNSKTNYIWADSTLDDVIIEWTIAPKLLTKPRATKTEFTYSSSEVDISTNFIVGYDSSTMNKSGTSATNAGNYQAVFSLKYKDNYKWSDNSTDDVVINWIINKSVINVYSSDCVATKTFTFNTSEQEIKSYINGYSSTSSAMTLSGTTKATAAGTYYAYITLDSNHCWKDGGTEVAEVEWKIEKLIWTKPVATVTDYLTFEYSGSDVFFKDILEGYGTSVLIGTTIAYVKLTVLIKSSGKETTWSVNAAGDYTLIARLIYPESSTWDDGTSEPVTFDFSIERKKLTEAQCQIIKQEECVYTGSNINNTAGSFSTIYFSIGRTLEALTNNTGVFYGTSIGTYSFWAVPTENYAWSNGDVDAREIVWRIVPVKVAIPYISPTNFEFSAAISRYGPTRYNEPVDAIAQRSGTVSADEIGNYTITYTLLKTGYVWEDGSTEPVVLNWSIGLAKIAPPTISDITFTYDGNSHAPTLSGVDTTKMTVSGDQSAVNAGEYQITVSLKNTSSYMWESGEVDDLIFTWKINRKPLTSTQSTFSQSGTLNYNGSAQTVTINNYDSNYHSLGGTYVSTDAGDFVAQISPLPNYCWNNNTYTAKTVVWKINPLKLSKPTASVTEFTYDKQTHALTVQNYNSSYITQSGTVSASAAGSYTAQYKLKNTNNTKWADSSTADVIIAWSITKTRVTKPTLTTSTFAYNGSNKTVTVNNLNSSYVNQSGVTQAKDAGTYQITFSLIDKTLAEWEDSTTENVVLSWTITPSALNNAYSNPYQKSVPNYSGRSISVKSTTILTGYNATYQVWSGDTEAVNAGEYTAYVTPADNYTWQDGTVTRKTVTWTIAPAEISAPSIDESVALTYNGNVQSPTLTGYNSTTMTLGGTTSSTDAGDFTLTVSPASENYIWDSGGSAPINLYWSIAKLVKYDKVNITVVANTGGVIRFRVDGFSSSDLTFKPVENGTEVDFDSDVLSYSGDLSGFHIGNYYITFTFKNSNYVFKGGSNSYTATWRISSYGVSTQFIIAANQNETNLTYTGAALDAPIGHRTESIWWNVNGTPSATAIGNYSLTFSLKYPNDTYWYWTENGTLHSTTEDQIFYWSIGVTPITPPTVSSGMIGYDGTPKTVTVNGFDSNTMTKSGVETATAKGFYKIIVSLKDKTGTCWSTGGNEDIVLEWALGARRVAKPTLSDGATTTFTYDGTAKTLSVEGFDSTYMNQTGYLSATDAGSYTVKFSLRVTTEDYYWQDDSRDDISFTWKIEKAKLPAVTFSQSGTLTYDGTAKTITIKNYNPATMDISGETSAITAGAHVAKITPKANYTWSDNTVTAKSVSWSIYRKPLTKPSASTLVFEYDGNPHSLTVSNYNSAYMNQTGDISATEAGSYSAVYSLKDTTNTAWSDYTQNSVVINWSIGGSYLYSPNIIPRSQTSKGLTQTHSVQVAGFDSATMTQTGTVSVNSGKAATYSVTFALKDKVNNQWTVGGSDNITYEWTVEKKILSVAESTFNQDVAIAYDGNAHTVQEACTNIKAAYLGEFYTVSGASQTAAGSYTATITPTAAALWSDKTSTAKTISWTIAEAANNLVLSANSLTISLGTTVTVDNCANYAKSITFTTPSNGDLTVSCSDYNVAWVGITSGSKTIAASSGKINVYPRGNGEVTITVNQAASSGYGAATTTFTVKVSTAAVFYTWSEIAALTKNGSLTNYMPVGCYKIVSCAAGTVGDSALESQYYTARLIGFDHNAGIEGTNRAHFLITQGLYPASGKTVANSKFADSVVHYNNSVLRASCNEFFDLLPSALQNVITACRKYFYHGNGSYNYVTDKIWVPSAVEVTGRLARNTNTFSQVAQYDYWANGNSKKFSANYWTRDREDSYFNYINTSGTAATVTDPTLSYGLLPCFTIS